MRRAALAGLLLALVSPLRAQETLILENGRIWTNDPAAPEATGLVVQDGRIARVVASMPRPELTPHEAARIALHFVTSPEKPLEAAPVEEEPKVGRGAAVFLVTAAFVLGGLASRLAARRRRS